MRIGIFGPGVIGSIIGGKLAIGGHDVTLIGRGSRLEQLKSSGLRLRAPGSSVVETPEVEVWGGLGEGAPFGWLIVCVRAHAADVALKAVAAEDKSENVLTMINHAQGVGEWTTLVGARLAFGFPGLSGTIDETGAVDYRVAPKRIQPSSVGEASGERSARILALSTAFNNVHVPTVVRNDIDAWLRSHVGWIHILGLAIASVGGDIERLRADKALTTELLVSLQESLSVVEAAGTTLTPGGLKWLKRTPIAALRMAATVALGRPEVEAAFADASEGQRLEMQEMTRQVQALAKQSATEMPTHSKLARLLLE